MSPANPWETDEPYESDQDLVDQFGARPDFVVDSPDVVPQPLPADTVTTGGGYTPGHGTLGTSAQGVGRPEQAPPADLREQWEYRETNSGNGGVQTDFAMMGERGWELVAATPRTAADTITGKPYSYVVHAWKRRIV